ncbi:MAG: hypothetical protein KDE28_12980, partial [Anaerolineales bacterium]|nr:hypothetical protein [Anaerolineales bacterium]
ESARGYFSDSVPANQMKSSWISSPTVPTLENMTYFRCGSTIIIVYLIYLLAGYFVTSRFRPVALIDYHSNGWWWFLISFIVPIVALAFLNDSGWLGCPPT